MTQYKDYGYESAKPAHTAVYLLPPIRDLLGSIGPGTRILDVGCGNGYICGQLLENGCTVVGIDLSEQGISIARQTYPKGRFEVLAADRDVLANLHEQPFDIVLSTEVVEHLYDPKSYIAGCHAALKPGGRMIVSTPYHGYLKNLALSVFNKWDWHLKPLWDGGHIKFWSRETLGQLMTEAGLTNIQFRGAGRYPYMWMSMVMSGERGK